MYVNKLQNSTIIKKKLQWNDPSDVYTIYTYSTYIKIVF